MGPLEVFSGAGSDTGGLGWGGRGCVSSKLAGVAHAAGPEVMRSEAEGFASLHGIFTAVDAGWTCTLESPGEI